jgi:cell division protein ZapD
VAFHRPVDITDNRALATLRGHGALTDFLVYEQPLNERIRLLLRMEHLLLRVSQSIDGQRLWDSHVAVDGLLEIASLVSRGDLKSELMKEIERQNAVLRNLVSTPGVDRYRLEQILDRQKSLVDRLHSIAGKIGSHLETNEFLTAIRQRSAIPGGACDFDLPAYHYWLRQPAEERRETLRGWLQPFDVITEAIELAVGLIRDSASPVRKFAEKGFAQENLDPANSYQMIRVFLPTSQRCFPEISAGKHRYTIRFLEQPSPNKHPHQIPETVEFQCAACYI